MEELTVELCKQKAEECIEYAERLAEPKQKAAMLQFAEGWMRLAVYRVGKDLSERGPHKDHEG